MRTLTDVRSATGACRPSREPAPLMPPLQGERVLRYDALDDTSASPGARDGAKSPDYSCAVSPERSVRVTEGPPSGCLGLPRGATASRLLAHGPIASRSERWPDSTRVPPETLRYTALELRCTDLSASGHHQDGRGWDTVTATCRGHRQGTTGDTHWSTPALTSQAFRHPELRDTPDGGHDHTSPPPGRRRETAPGLRPNRTAAGGTRSPGVYPSLQAFPCPVLSCATYPAQSRRSPTKFSFLSTRRALASPTLSTRGMPSAPGASRVFLSPIPLHRPHPATSVPRHGAIRPPG